MSINYRIYRTLRVLMIPFVLIHLAFTDQRIATFVKLKKEFKERINNE